MTAIEFPSISGRWTRDDLLYIREDDPILPDDLLVEARKLFGTFQQKHPNSYDGSLVSLLGLERTQAGVSLRFANASFSWYLATRNAKNPKSWPRANPIGTTSIMLTSDHHVVASIRSLKADQNPGALYYAGGFAELCDDGAFDLFDNAEREVAEEIGLSDDNFSQSNTLIGLDYDRMFPHPEAFFLVQLKHSSEDLRAHFATFSHEEAERIELFSLEAFMQLKNADQPLTWSFETGRRFLNDFIQNGNLT